MLIRAGLQLPLTIVAMAEPSPTVNRIRREIREKLGAETIEVRQSLDTPLQIRRCLMQMENLKTGETSVALPRHRLADDYQHGESLASPLCRELAEYAGVPLFQLRIDTGWSKQIEVIFEKVTVRKVTPVKYESFTEGKRVRLTHVFRG